ncbi:MAG: prepilin-type N-terminal cleavage/methylation domain-containing protein [Patescibacteria group bacterium]
MNRTKGFTLIELLVVISIIGLLSSVVFASVSVAKAKGRDAKRISDIRQIKIAMELYKDSTGYYPTNLTNDLVPTYIKSIAQDIPSGGACRPHYCYAYWPSLQPTSYHIGAQMENISGVVLNSDSDINSSGFYTGGFDGIAPNVYDIRN